MDQQALLIVMTVFVAVAAIALIIQAGMLIGMRKSSRAVEAQVAKIAPKVEALIPKIEALTPKIESVLESSRAAIDESRTSFKEITSRTTAILDSTQRQLARVEEVVQDAAERARSQFDRAEMVLDDAMNRAQETVAVVHGGIMKPIREITGVAAGIRAAMHYFARGGRPSPDQATVDEEMFI